MARPTVRWLMELLGQGWCVVVERVDGRDLRHNRHVWAHPNSPRWFVVEVGNALGSAASWIDVEYYTYTSDLDGLEQQRRLRVVTFAEARRAAGPQAQPFMPVGDDGNQFRRELATRLLEKP